jgi:hypothetical protein
VFDSAGLKEVLLWQPLWIVIFAVGFVWSIGYYGFGFWWSLWAVPLFFSWQKLQHDRVLRRSIFEYEKLCKSNKESHTESAEWMNRCIKSIWVTTEDYIISTISDQSAPLLEKNKPPMVNQLTLENLVIGSKFPSLSEVTVHDAAPGQLYFDAQLQFYSELSLELVAKVGLARFPILVRDFFMKSKVRVHVWLLPHPPFMSHLQFSFVGEPVIDMIVKPIKIGPDVMSVPGLSAAIKKMMCDIVHQLFVYPNHFEYILTPEFVQREGDLELLHESDGLRGIPAQNTRIPNTTTDVEGAGVTTTGAVLEAGIQQENRQNLVEKRKKRDKIMHFRKHQDNNLVEHQVIENEPILAKEALTQRNNPAPKFTVREAPEDCVIPTTEGKPQGLGIDLDMLEKKYSQDDSVASLSTKRRRSKNLQKSHSDRSKHFKH